jgi:hypothetical protein
MLQQVCGLAALYLKTRILLKRSAPYGTYHGFINTVFLSSVVNAFDSRFSSPSQFSMDLAAKFLEDQQFMQFFLRKSQRELLRSRLLTEDLLKAAGLKFHENG